MIPTHIHRCWYVLHALRDDKSGKFDLSQHTEDFPDGYTHQQIKDELEQRLGSHQDGSWQAKKGFVDGVRCLRIPAPTKPQQDPIMAQETASQEYQPNSAKPQTKLPKK